MRLAGMKEILTDPERRDYYKFQNEHIVNDRVGYAEFPDVELLREFCRDFDCDCEKIVGSTCSYCVSKTNLYDEDL